MPCTRTLLCRAAECRAATPALCPSALRAAEQIAGAERTCAYASKLATPEPSAQLGIGAEFKSIAEAKTKEVLEAYDYFRKKYDIR